MKRVKNSFGIDHILAFLIYSILLMIPLIEIIDLNPTLKSSSPLILLWGAMVLILFHSFQLICQNKRTLLNKHFIYGVFIYLMAGLLSLFNSINIWQTFYQWLIQLSLIACAWVSARLSIHEAFRKHVFFIFISLMGLCIFAFISSRLDVSIDLWGLLPISIPCLVYFILSESSPGFIKLLGLGLLFSLIFMVGLSGDLWLWGFCLFSLMFSFFVSTKRIKGNLNPAKIGISVGILFIALSSLFLNPNRTHFLKIVSNHQSLKHESDAWSEKIPIWNASINMLVDHPLFGIGLGGFKNAYPAYHLYDEFSYQPHEEEQSYPHQYLMFLGIEQGFCGLISWLFLFIVMIRQYLRRRKNSQILLLDDLGFAVPWLLIFLLGLGTNFMNYLPIELLFWIFGGVLLGQTLAKPDSTKRLSKLQLGIHFLTWVVIVSAVIWIGKLSWTQYQSTRIFNEAVLNRKFDKLAATIQKLNQSLSLNPYQDKAHFELGSIYLSQKYYGAAIKEMNLASQFAPFKAEIYLILAQAYQGRSQNQMALNQLSKAHLVNPRDETILLMLLKHLLNMNLSEKAYELIQSWYPSIPMRFDYFNIYGKIYEKLQMFPESFEYYKKAIQLNSENWEVLFDAATVLKMNQKNSAAIYLYQKVIELKSVCLPAWQHMIECLYLEQDYPKTKDAIDQLLKQDPQNKIALYYTAKIYLHEDQTQKAMDILHQLILNDENFLNARDLYHRLQMAQNSLDSN